MCMFDLVEILILEQKNSASRNRQRPTTKQLLNAPIFCVCVCVPSTWRATSVRISDSQFDVSSHIRATLTHTHAHERERDRRHIRWATHRHVYCRVVYSVYVSATYVETSPPIMFWNQQNQTSPHLIESNFACISCKYRNKLIVFLLFLFHLCVIDIVNLLLMVSKVIAANEPNCLIYEIIGRGLTFTWIKL